VEDEKEEGEVGSEEPPTFVFGIPAWEPKHRCKRDVAMGVAYFFPVFAQTRDAKQYPGPQIAFLILSPIKIVLSSQAHFSFPLWILKRRNWSRQPKQGWKKPVICEKHVPHVPAPRPSPPSGKNSRVEA